MSSGTRRDFLRKMGIAIATLPEIRRSAPKKIAAIVTVYTHNSHADVIVSRILEGFNLQGEGPFPNLKLASLYLDQIAPKDKGQALARQHGVRLAATITDAVTLGGKEVAVDGVLLIGEHGNYPVSETGQTMYPRRRWFEETAAVFKRGKRVVPMFSDKHLSWNWSDAKWMYDTAKELKIPLMAGSSLPVTWRRPSMDVERGARMTEAVGISYHTLDAYGFHALEVLQCLAERRRGGETGVANIQCLDGPEVWDVFNARFDRGLFSDAWSRREQPGILSLEQLRKCVTSRTAFLIEYRDGFRAAIITLNPVNHNWSIAWREEDQTRSTLFWTQEARPFGHFSFLLQGIEQMIHTGIPTWPVERTLLTTGMLDALLTSKLRGGIRVETPELAIAYQPTFRWQSPPAPPPGRPLDAQ